MSRVPDWVLDSKLETHFLPGSKYETVHTYYEQESLSRRPIKKTEHWQRDKKIGSGGFGEVWLERCTKGNNNGYQVRATKEMEVRHQIDYGRELEAIAKFSHSKYERCFVKSFGWYETETSLFITMEYLELGDLQDYLRGKHKPLPEFEARGIMSQILEGLDLMHDNGFAHRDLKPNNILLRSCPPGDWWVKIADFGISKRIGEEVAKSTTMKGTPGYIAPELYEFTKRGTAYAIDMWAAGEVMFHILTKQATFRHPGLLFNYVQTPTVFPSSKLFENQVSQVGIEFVLRLMDPTPSGRMSAKDALQHRWINEPLPYDNRNSPTLAPKEAHTISAFDPMIESSASWNTAKSPREFETSILKRTEKLGTSRLQPSNNKAALAEARTTSELDSMAEDSASWDTVKPLEAFTAFISSKTEKLGTSPLQPSNNTIAQSQPVRHKTAAPVGMMRLSRILAGHHIWVTSAVFSPDSKLVACGSANGAVKIWNTATGAIHKTLKGYPAGVTSVAFSPNGNLVAFGSHGQPVVVENVIMASKQKMIGVHSREVTCVAFSPDGKSVLSGSTDWTVKLWHITTAASGRVVDVWNAIAGPINNRRRGHSGAVTCVAFSPDGELAASGSNDWTVNLWDATTGDICRTLEGHARGITCVAFSLDGKCVASGSNDETVKLWDTTTGVNFQTVRLWNLDTGAIHKTDEGDSRWVISVAFSPDGKLVASGSDGKTLKIWDITAGSIRRTLQGSCDQVQSMAFSPDGKLAASGHYNGRVRLWDAAL